jgi:hypothetical protein
MEKGCRYPAYLSPVDNNNTLCAARGVAGQNASEIRWRYEHTLLLGFRPCLDIAPLPLQQPDRIFHRRRDKKQEYAEGAIDKSYWHLHAQEQERLYPDDRDNPIWNEASRKGKVDSAE